MLSQAPASAAILRAYVEFAREIGCDIGEGAFSDSITVHTLDQWEKLADKWVELTEAFA